MGSTPLQGARENAPGKSPTNRRHSPTPARLARHFRTVPVCAGTVAAQGWNVEVQPGFGSKANETLEDATALQVWSTSGLDTLQPAQGWAATIHARRLLDSCRGSQGLTKEEVTQGVYDILRREPISFEEIHHIHAKLQEQVDHGEQSPTSQVLLMIMEEARQEVTYDKETHTEVDAQIFLEKRLQLTTALPQTPTSYR